MTEAKQPPKDPADLPERIGPYRVLEQLGEGGMGLVYLAEQREPVRRRVALKVIKLGMDSKEVLARFEAERQAVSLMEHPNVAHIFDAGATERGQPWFAMELVKGIPITEYCDQHRLTIRERLELFCQVCDGVQHAHQKGVMHRDLKPSNVLVTLQDGRPTPKIIDFGLAKATDQHLTEATLFTQQGQILGTPTYMSPEQAGLTNLDVDSRTDVYALGVLLYELLTGELPFRNDELLSAGFLGMIKMIRETEPPKPSTRVTTLGADSTEIAKRRGVDDQGLRKRLRGDLDWIVMRSLEKDRTRRYQTANALAADLSRHLRFEPVTAGPPGVRYRLGRFVRRNRGQVLAGAVLAVALVGGVVGIAWFALEARAQAKTAEQRGAEFDQLAGVVRLQAAQDDAAELHPPWPEKIPAMEAWLTDQVDPLLGQRPEIERTLASLRARDVMAVSERFLHDTLEGLLDGLEELEANEKRAVDTRLKWARRIDSWTRNHPEARATWADADRAHSFDLKPQTGLVPIGKNPATGLWEFYDLRTAWNASGDVEPGDLPIPVHAADGAIRPTDDMGLVMILIPGGRFTMGAEREVVVDGSADPNLDNKAEPDEGPCRLVELAPFFLSRFEMTQGQWFRLSDGEQPSMYEVGHDYEGIGMVGWTQPVEQVSWLDCDLLLRQNGMELPTEAQWEYACRAGTRTRYWTGDETSSLAGVANVLDVTAAKLYPNWGRRDVDFDDGFAGPAPVGRYRANRFGLHDLHGNVMEWCRDRYGTYTDPFRPGDGLRQVADDDGTVTLRDGCHQMPARNARSSARDRNSPTIRFALLGVRPARPLR